MGPIELRDDRRGNSWPVLLTSWGSGQNILYSWLTMPLIALFGLNMFSLRLTAALCGIEAVAVFWRLARQCRRRICGLCALFLITVNPWHIMASRWALESNIMPLFLLSGLLCTVKAREDIRWLFGAAVSFALALYAYGTAFFFLPLILVSYVLINRSLLREKIFYAAGALFSMLALPIGLCQLINMTGADGFTVLGITLPKLTEARQMAVSVFGTGQSGLLQNARDFLDLLITQSDGFHYNALPVSGLYYFFGLPLAAAGFLQSVKDRACPKELAVRLALYVACLCACFISVNINRVNMVWLPLLYFQAVGLEWLLCYLDGKWSLVPIVGILLCFALFLADYGVGLDAPSNLEGLNDAIACAETVSDGDIYITDSLPASYIYVLFLRQIPPADFADTVVYSNPGSAFQNVTAFGRYSFDSGPKESGAACFVLTRNEFERLDDGRFTQIDRFGGYVVCVPAG